MVEQNQLIKNTSSPFQLSPPITSRDRVAIAAERQRRAQASASRFNQREANRIRKRVTPQFERIISRYKEKLRKLQARAKKGDEDAQDELSATKRAVDEVENRFSKYKKLSPDKNADEIIGFGNNYASEVERYASQVEDFYESRARARNQRKQVERTLRARGDVALVFDKGKWTGQVVSKTELPQELAANIKRSTISAKDIDTYNKNAFSSFNQIQPQQLRQPSAAEERLQMSVDTSQSPEALAQAGFTREEIEQVKLQSFAPQAAQPQKPKGVFRKVKEKVDTSIEKVGEATADFLFPQGVGASVRMPKGSDIFVFGAANPFDPLIAPQYPNTFFNTPQTTGSDLALRSKNQSSGTTNNATTVPTVTDETIQKEQDKRFKKFLDGQRISLTNKEAKAITKGGVDIGTYTIPVAGQARFWISDVGSGVESFADYIYNTTKEKGIKALPKDIQGKVTEFFTQEELIKDIEKEEKELRATKITDFSQEYIDPVSKSTVSPEAFNAEIDRNIAELQEYKQQVKDGRYLRAGGTAVLGGLAAYGLTRSIAKRSAEKKFQAELLNYNQAKKQFDELKRYANVVKREKRAEQSLGAINIGQLSRVEQTKLLNQLNKLGMNVKKPTDITAVNVGLSTEKVVAEVPVMKKIAVPKSFKGLNKKQENIYTVYTAPKTTYENKLLVSLTNKQGVTEAYVYVFPTKKPLGNFRNIESALKYATNRRLVRVRGTADSNIFVSQEYKLRGQKAIEGGTFLTEAKVLTNKNGEFIVVDTRKAGGATPFTEGLEEAFGISPRVSQTVVKTKKGQPQEVSGTFMSDFEQLGNAIRKDSLFFEGTQIKTASVGATKTEAVVFDASYVYQVVKQQAEVLKKLPKSRLTKRDRAIINLADKTKKAAKEGKNVKIGDKTIQALDVDTRFDVMQAAAFSSASSITRTRAQAAPKAPVVQDIGGFETATASRALKSTKEKTQKQTTPPKAEQTSITQQFEELGAKIAPQSRDSVKTKSGQRSAQQQRQELSSLTKQFEELVARTSQTQSPTVRQQPKTRQETGLRALAANVSFPRPQSSTRATPRRTPKTPRPTSRFGFPTPPPKKKKKKGEKDAEDYWGFVTEVKRKGKFKAESNAFGSIQEALAFGFEEVDKTLARTFRVRAKRVKGRKPQKEQGFAGDLDALGKNFYTRQQGGDILFIEKREKALSRKGETRAIQKARRSKNAEKFWLS